MSPSQTSVAPPTSTRHHILSEALTRLGPAHNGPGRARAEVPVVASPGGGSVRLVLSESADEPGYAAPWTGPLLVLGTRAARHARKAIGRQLVIAVSVPKRDFAATLVGCGWVLASEVPVLPDPLEALRELEPGQPLRAVNSRQVITGFFWSLNEAVNPPRAQFAGSEWRVDLIRAIVRLADLEQPERTPRPEPGSVEHMAGIDLAWDARIASPAADLAIVGTAAWLKEDFVAYLAREGDELPPSAIEGLLLPKVGRVATWFTRLYSSARLAEHLPLPRDLRAVILDGNGAIKYLAEFETPVVICVLDRSVADETAAELVTQLRNTRGEPVSLFDELGWRPPAGVEALAFTMAL